MDSTIAANSHNDVAVAKDINQHNNFAARALDESWSDSKARMNATTKSVADAASPYWIDLEKGAKICGEIGKGAVNEIRFHPLGVLESAALGAAVGVGTAFLTPEIAVVGTIMAAGYVGYKLGQNIPKWTHDGEVVANPQSFSPSEYIAADRGLKSLGAGITENTAALGAGGITSDLVRTGAMMTASAISEEGSLIGGARNYYANEASTTGLKDYLSNAQGYAAAGAGITGLLAISSMDKKIDLQKKKK
jgi:hypothetical protein